MLAQLFLILMLVDKVNVAQMMVCKKSPSPNDMEETC